MNQQSGYSNEILNAYVDGELSVEDELMILDAMKNDTDLQNRVNELKRIKLLVTTTYPINESETKPLPSKKAMNLSLVASFILTVGIVGGWLSHDVLLKDGTPLSKSYSKKDDAWNIVLHVSTNDKYIQKTILDETESLLESFKESKQKVRVEIVAYGKGVFLFDKDKSKYKGRLMSLRSDFSNLSYAVCGRTIKRLEQKQGHKIKLISDLTVARSGIYQIIKRQKQGWNYIRI